METVTLLSILACDSIAVPLSSAFPASELRYILENSEAATLLSSGKFREKAEEVLKEGLEHLLRKPILNVLEKRHTGNGEDEVQLVPLPMTKGGMMLYTSGTTSRPVYMIIVTPDLAADFLPERRPPSRKSPDSASGITPQSLAIYLAGSSPPCPPPPSYSWRRQRPPHPPLRRLNHRVHVPLQRRRGLGAPSRAIHAGQEQGAYHILDSCPNNIQPLSLLVRQAFGTYARSYQESFIAGESTPQYFWIRCATNAYEEVMDRAERW